MTTSKRTTRGTTTTRGTNAGGGPDNGAAPASAAPPGAPPPKARVRQRKSTSSSSRTTESRAAPAEAPRPADRYASIAQAAYFRSQRRGFKPGHEMEDWLAAEAEVDQRLRGESRLSGDSTD